MAPPATEAQQGKKVWRIGWLRQGGAFPREVDGFRQGLRDQGYVEGQHFVLEHRSGEGKVDPLPGFAAELVRLPVDVLMTQGVAATLAAREATSTIPIVFCAVPEPVENGLVASLAQPGGHLTGAANASLDFMAGKLLEMLKEVAPAATRVAVLANVDNPGHGRGGPALQAAAQALGMQLHLLEVHMDVQDPATALERVFATLPQGGVEAFFIPQELALIAHRTQIVELVNARRLPAIYGTRRFVDVGGLMSYQADVPAMFRRAGNLVGKILRGAKPADLPVENPMKFELVINLKTARALGMMMPPTLLILADEVIQ
jgi:putative ABC transport system substrate-binding protein